MGWFEVGFEGALMYLYRRVDRLMMRVFFGSSFVGVHMHLHFVKISLHGQ